MDKELALYLRFTRRLPSLPRISAIVNRLLKPFYLRKPRPTVTADVDGLSMELNPAEAVDGALLFYPQIYDRPEIAFMKQRLPAGGVFIDAGAYIGYYSLQAARLIRSGQVRSGQVRSGQVLAIEAEPQAAARIQRNADLNGFGSLIRTIQCGLSDRTEVLSLGVHTTGNRGGSSFLLEGTHTVKVQCYPLFDVLQKEGIAAIDGMKIDIESMEFRVLARFFMDAPKTLWPGFIILEYFSENDKAAGGSSLQLVLEQGYRIIQKTGYNYMLLRSSAE